MHSLHCVLNEQLEYISYSTENSIIFYIFFEHVIYNLGHMPAPPTTETWYGSTDVVMHVDTGKTHLLRAHEKIRITLFLLI